MRVGIFGDIHGNLAALDAALAVLAGAGVDQLVCLGDVAGTGPQPAECLARLADLRCRCVLGNVDADLLDPSRLGAGVDEAEADEDARRIWDIDRWCAGQLDEAGRATLRAFEATVEVDLGGGERLLCCHGSPASFDDRIDPDTPADGLDGMLGVVGAMVVAAGHTHAAMVRSHRGTTLLNPGSVGLAYDVRPDGTLRVPPWAEVAVLTVGADSTRSVELRRVPYDRGATVRAMRERGMPHAAWWASDWV